MLSEKIRSSNLGPSDEGEEGRSLCRHADPGPMKHPRYRGVIFHRHGHRSPAKSLLAGGDVETWLPLLLSKNTLDELANRFPVVSHTSNGEPKDVVSHPFGCLSNKGFAHLVERGRAMGQKFPFIRGLHPSCFRVYATNYQRTQLSACGLLSGLMKEPTSNKRTVINVRPMAACSMSFYDGHSDRALGMIKKTQATKMFRDVEDSEPVVRVKTAFANKWPRVLLKSPDLKTFDWPAAFDHFACRRAHKLPVWLGDTGDIHEGEGYDKLDAFISHHMSSRFWLYYQDHEHIAAVAKPLLVDLLQSLTDPAGGPVEQDANIPSSGNSTTSSSANVNTLATNANSTNSLLTIFSGHDVNLLSLLTALGSDFIGKDAPSGYWPEYGDVIYFQLQGDQQTVQTFINNVPLNLFGTKKTRGSPTFKISQLEELIAKI